MTSESPLTLTEAAARRINKIVADEKNPALLVRLEVAGGGCSGYSYKFGFDSNFDAAEDILITRDGAKLVVDKTSLDLLKGSEVGYGEKLIKGGVKGDEPHAASRC